jgi:hypothetical protein
MEIYLLGFLGILSLVTGYYFKDLFTGFGSNYFSNNIYNMPNNFNSIELEFIPAIIKLLPVILSFISFIIAIYLNKKFKYYQINTYFENCK